MFLRNIRYYNHHKGGNNSRIKLLRIVLFTAVISIALVASSLTESESAPLLSKNSLVSNGTEGAMLKAIDNN